MHHHTNFNAVAGKSSATFSDKVFIRVQTHRAHFLGNEYVFLGVSPLHGHPGLSIIIINHKGLRGLVDAGLAANAAVLVNKHGHGIAGPCCPAQRFTCRANYLSTASQ
eukprot:scaffold339880_cov49-Prasinocladus_malaysianus.AAC.1